MDNEERENDVLTIKLPEYSEEFSHIIGEVAYKNTESFVENKLDIYNRNIVADIGHKKDIIPESHKNDIIPEKRSFEFDKMITAVLKWIFVSVLVILLMASILWSR